MPEDQSPEQIFSTQGVPFKTEQVAKKVMTEKGLSNEFWRPVPVDGGFAIQRRAQEIKPEKYWRVKFANRQNAWEDEDVILAVNGDVLVIPRDVETIIPDRYRECADHTTRPKFTQLPGQARKQVGEIQTYPYTVLGESSEADYRKLLKEGNEKTRDELKKAQKLV